MLMRWVAVFAAGMILWVAGARGEEVVTRAPVELRAAKTPEFSLTPSEAALRGLNLAPQTKAPSTGGLVGEAVRASAPIHQPSEAFAVARARGRIFVRFSLVGIVELRC